MFNTLYLYLYLAKYTSRNYSVIYSLRIDGTTLDVAGHGRDIELNEIITHGTRFKPVTHALEYSKYDLLYNK